MYYISKNTTVRSLGVIGGGAVVASVTALASYSIIQSLSALGGLGILGGSIMAGTMALMTPQQVSRCPAGLCQINNKCCPLIRTPNGVICPETEC